MIDVKQLAEFIHCNNTGHQKCGYVGSTSNDIIHDLEDGLKENSYLLYQGNEISGSITLDIYDVGENGQSDIEVWGPYSKVDDISILKRLLIYLHEVTRSRDIRNIHFFISEDNRLVMDYMNNLGIIKSSGHYYYSVDLTGDSDSHDLIGSLSITRLDSSEPKLLAQVIDLHDNSFIDSILTKEDIIAEAECSENSDYDIYSVLHTDCFLGYVIVRKNERTLVINLEYLCVTPEERNKGVGKQIIGFIMDIYNKLQYTKMDLIVRDNNKGAIDFYDRLNFVREAKMLHIIVDGAMNSYED
ncbi:putative acetyltransferase [compost metagenome]